MRNDFRPLDMETVEKAASILRRKAAHEQRAVKLLAALKHSGLVGRVFNASCLPLAQKALAEYSVRYSIREYSMPRWRCLYVSCPTNASGPCETWEFDLATREAPRVTKETMDKEMDKARERAQDYLIHADQLVSNTPIYNNACSYLSSIWRQIDSAMLYADIRFW